MIEERKQERGNGKDRLGETKDKMRRGMREGQTERERGTDRERERDRQREREYIFNMHYLP